VTHLSERRRRNDIHLSLLFLQFPQFQRGQYGLSLALPIPCVISDTPLTLAANPRKASAINCGHHTNIGGHIQRVSPLRLAGLQLITRGIGRAWGSLVTKMFPPQPCLPSNVITDPVIKRAYKELGVLRGRTTKPCKNFGSTRSFSGMSSSRAPSGSIHFALDLPYTFFCLFAVGGIFSKGRA
jgi:hypothetical protein